ncbi:VOC family protein [Croceitalea dokdonensis]|nr:VOC family protein [Croceitalea dokdonensis]
MHLTSFMGKRCFLGLAVTILFSACTYDKTAVTEAFTVYTEMVANGAKPMAFHYPMNRNEIDRYWEEFKTIANEHKVSLFREDNFPATLLFAQTDTNDKTVAIIYKGDRLIQYQQWKVDALAADTTNRYTQEKLARRLGRLLGYSDLGINQLLEKNSNIKTLASFGTNTQTTHLYYEKLEEATAFYETILGLSSPAANTFKISKDGFLKLHSTDSAHPIGQPKSTAVALLTNQLPAWYAIMKDKNIPLKYSFNPKQGGPHDGFVAIDPGGYFLEFETFKQHPENELFMAILSKAERISTSHNNLDFFGTITWTYHKDMQKMQRFYQEKLGFELVADQGWAKIYQTAENSFVGLVDECRGMENYADQKAVELTWGLAKVESFYTHAPTLFNQYDASRKSFVGPENYRYNLGND